MTAPNAHDNTAADPDGTTHPSDVWTPTVIRPASDPPAEIVAAPADSSGVMTVASQQVPEPPEPPWRSTGRSRAVALDEGVQSGTDPEPTAELAKLREAAVEANERLRRQRTLLRQLDRQLTGAQRAATAAGLAAREAELRVAARTQELAAAHGELARLEALDLARTERVLAHIADHHQSLVATLRSDPMVGAPADGDRSAPERRRFLLPRHRRGDATRTRDSARSEPA